MCRAVSPGTCECRSCGCWVTGRGAGDCGIPGSPELTKQPLLSPLLESRYWAKRAVALTQQGMSYVLLFPGRLVGAHHSQITAISCGCCYFSFFSPPPPKKEIVEIPLPSKNTPWENHPSYWSGGGRKKALEVLNPATGKMHSPTPLTIRQVKLVSISLKSSCIFFFPSSKWAFIFVTVCIYEAFPYNSSIQTARFSKTVFSLHNELLRGKGDSFLKALWCCLLTDKGKGRKRQGLFFFFLLSFF